MTIVGLAAAAGNAQTYGGKAAQLGSAIVAGLPVPDGCALDPAVVDAIVQGDEAARAELGLVCEKMPGPLAVRSSALGEDGACASFAGQHATLLNIRGADAVAAAVETVWQSGKSAGAIAYRERVGADMAVYVGIVIQKLVAADVAGVLFTCNPVTGQDELVVEASWGLGEAIVQGLVIPDRFRISRTGDVLESRAGVKETAVRRAPEGATRQEAVAPDLVDRLCLDATQLSALRDLADRCDDVFGAGPHDIEWAFEAQMLYLLQLRPVTS
jgi:pyruvate,water dikinase